MSETQYEEPVYVVNKRRRASEAVVHMPDCEKIHHQVEQDVRPEVYRETRVPAYIRFVANYMTLTELRNIGFKYHPCGYCQPPVPTVDGSIPISVKARNLNICSFQGHCYCRRRPIALFDDYCGSRPPLLRFKATGC